MTRVLRLVAVNLMVFALTAELLSLAVFYWDTGHLFYLYRKPVDPVFAARDSGLTGEGLHPYFGPTHAAGRPFEFPDALKPQTMPPQAATNNFGFVSLHDYPFAGSGDRQFMIGIFGGSVGVWFCQVGVPRLLEDLKRHPFFNGRELVPLCFSHEGYKQPQQLQVLSYFLSTGQRFDLAINIDGFNEVALSSLNDQRGIDISMPSSMHMESLVNLANQFTLTPAKLQSLAAIERDRERMRRLTARIDGNRIASVHVVLEQYYRIVRNRYQAETVRFAALPSNQSDSSIIRVTPPTRQRQGRALYEQIAANWAEASRLMFDLLAARGVPYVHVLQPNQYFTSRRFSAEEARVALNDGSPFKAGAEQGYPALVADALTTRLRAHGVRFLDGTGIFDREPSAVYIDDCCHYTRRGYELLADFLADGILTSDGPWSVK
jgi:hypothetical protein